MAYITLPVFDTNTPLTPTQFNYLIDKLNARKLNDLIDVASGDPVDTDILRHNGSGWVFYKITDDHYTKQEINDILTGNGAIQFSVNWGDVQGDINAQTDLFQTFGALGAATNTWVGEHVAKNYIIDGSNEVPPNTTYIETFNISDGTTPQTVGEGQTITFTGTGVTFNAATRTFTITGGAGGGSVDWADITGVQSVINLSGFTNDAGFVSSGDPIFSNYLPIAGGTLTGALGGTTAVFSGTVAGADPISDADFVTRLFLSTNHYNKPEIDAAITASHAGIKYVWADEAARLAQTGMEHFFQGLQQDTRWVWIFNDPDDDGVGTWVQYYNLDADHNHDDRYYTETEIDTFLLAKANTGDLANYLPLSGGVMSGNISVANNESLRAANGLNGITIYNGSNANMEFRANHGTSTLRVFKFITGTTDRFRIDTSGAELVGTLIATDVTTGAINNNEAGITSDGDITLGIKTGAALEGSSFKTVPGADYTGVNTEAKLSSRGLLFNLIGASGGWARVLGGAQLDGVDSMTFGVYGSGTNTSSQYMYFGRAYNNRGLIVGYDGKVNIGYTSGGITGSDALTVNGNVAASYPTAAGHLATKQYVDDQAGSGGGGTITGVTAGSGLSGGGTVGTVTLSIPNSGITDEMLNATNAPANGYVPKANGDGTMTWSTSITSSTYASYLNLSDSSFQPEAVGNQSRLMVSGRSHGTLTSGVSDAIDTMALRFGDRGIASGYTNILAADITSGGFRVYSAVGGINTYYNYQGDMALMDNSSTYGQIISKGNWLRTPGSGLLPDSNNGAALGTASWNFSNTYSRNVYLDNLRERTSSGINVVGHFSMAAAEIKSGEAANLDLQLIPTAGGYVDLIQSHDKYAMIVHRGTDWVGFSVDASSNAQVGVGGTGNIRLMGNNYADLFAEFSSTKLTLGTGIGFTSNGNSVVNGTLDVNGSFYANNYYLGADRFLYTSGNNHYFDLKNSGNTNTITMRADTGTVTAIKFVGDGSGLTNLPGGGGGGDVYLASNQTFTGINTFTKDLIINGSAGAGDGIYFENRNHGITFNDGAGNFNIRIGNTTAGSSTETCTESGWVFQDEWSQTGGTRQFNISDASKTAGNNVSSSWRTQMWYDTNNVHFAYQGAEVFNTSSEGLTFTGGNFIKKTGALSGFIEGDHETTASNTHSNPIFTIGDGWSPNLTTLGSMYGIGYADSRSASFINGTDLGTNPNDQWGFYVAANGDAHHYLDGNSGNSYQLGSAYASAFYEHSDRKFKENIKDVDDVFSTYTLKADESKRLRYGVVAQRVEEKYPEVVLTDSDGVKSVDYKSLHSAELIEAKKRISELERKVEALMNLYYE